MVQIRENRQKLIDRYADAGLLRTETTLGTHRMFVCIIKMLTVVESAP